MSNPIKTAKHVRSSAWLERAGWSFQERGWWTHTTRGGICRETGGKWWAYPYIGDRLGPFKNARAAARSNDQALRVARRTDLQISKWWAWGWAGASGKHAAMNMRGETTGRKLKRIERRMRVAVKRWAGGGVAEPVGDGNASTRSGAGSQNMGTEQR